MTTDIAAEMKVFELLVRQYGPETARRLFAQLRGEDDANRVLHEYEKQIGLITKLPGSPTLQDRTRFKEWYSGPSEDDRYWPALKKHLLEVKKWPANVVDSLDLESTNVMKRLPPVYGQVDVKGLVVGYVQSGKTANYSALIAKAADVGYRLIIVLAGIHNSLRRQTQLRLSAELIDTDPNVKKYWHTLTLPQEDFRAGNTNTDAFLSDVGNHRILLVVKKNAQVLQRLINWLKRANSRLLESCPALLIDDEADQAGLNTARAGDNSRTAINGLILELKGALPKSAYVGYTATPFANVLIDPSGDDLYPSDFIVALRKPASYFGAELFFGREPLDEDDVEPPAPPNMFRVVPVDDVPFVRPANAASADGFKAKVPESLRTAIEYFLLATAARWARGQRMKHSSMLVHTALTLRVHDNLAKCVEAELARIGRSLKGNQMVKRLQSLWEEESAQVPREGLAPVPFAEVHARLADVLGHTEVVVDNSQSLNRLLYKDESELKEADKVVHIAVGGNTLSRGLTLEGLTVSYFVRSASAYDTLLQMGRWFGYRHGYEDLPRIWMTDELRKAFFDLATIEEEIRHDIARYDEEGRTPKQFAVRIRTHPAMAVTSRLKMQYAVPVGIDYTGSTRQTTFFHHKDANWLRANWLAGADLVDRIIAARGPLLESGAHRFAKNVDVEWILQFIDKYECHPDHTEMRKDLLKAFIRKQNGRGLFKNWTVAVTTLTDATLDKVSLGELLVAPVVRSKLQSRDDGVDLGTITTQRNFTFDMAPDLRGGSKKTGYRPADQEPLLLLVPIRKDSAPTRPNAPSSKPRSQLDAVEHILGLALAFPASRTNQMLENYIQVQLPRTEQYMDEEEDAVAEDDG